MAGTLTAWVVPDARMARAAGLDLAAAGLEIAATPRHASVLLVVADLPPGLAEAATIVYAQMPRPRAILSLGAEPPSPLPAADVIAAADQAGLAEGVARLRTRIAEGAWSPEVEPFTAAVLAGAAVDATGGMDHSMMGHGHHMHHGGMDHSQMGHVTMDHGSMDHGAMDHGTMNHGGMDHGAMHHGGMDHSQMDHSQMNHGQMDHGSMDHSALGHGAMGHHAPASGEQEPEPHAGADHTGHGDHARMDHSGHAHMHHGATTGADAADPQAAHQDMPEDSGDAHAAHDAPAAHDHHAHMHHEGGPAAQDEAEPDHADHAATMLDDQARASDHATMHPAAPPAASEHDSMDHGAMHHHHHHPDMGPGVPERPDEPGEADHGAMDHAAMDHSKMAHGAMGDSAGADTTPNAHTRMPHGGTDQDKTVHGSMSHGAMDPGTMDHGAMGHGTPERAATDDSAGAGTAPDEHAHVHHAGMDHGAMDHGQMDHGQMDHSAMNHGQMDHSAMNHGQMDHGQMNHAGMDHSAMGHGGMDHSMMGHDHHMMDGGFMSMVAMTQGLPRSTDGLPMEWIDSSFGPLFPGLPAGLAPTLTLDGDTVAGASLGSGAVHRGIAATLPGPAASFPDRLAILDPLAPMAYRALAQQAIAAISGEPPDAAPSAWVGACEHERAASHMGWLAAFGELLGIGWLANRAAELHLALVRAADVATVAALRGRIARMVHDVNRLPMLERRLAGIGALAPDAPAMSGPVARGSGLAVDARMHSSAYQAHGFEPMVREGGDALARLQVRLAEILQSLDLVIASGTLAPPVIPSPNPHLTGTGMATVETPRGAAMLHLGVHHGQVSMAHPMPPSATHQALITPVTDQAELADALVAIASLDLSPWEIDQ